MHAPASHGCTRSVRDPSTERVRRRLDVDDRPAERDRAVGPHDERAHGRHAARRATCATSSARPSAPDRRVRVEQEERVAAGALASATPEVDARAEAEVAVGSTSDQPCSRRRARGSRRAVLRAAQVVDDVHGGAARAEVGLGDVLPDQRGRAVVHDDDPDAGAASAVHAVPRWLTMRARPTGRPRRRAGPAGRGSRRRRRRRSRARRGRAIHSAPGSIAITGRRRGCRERGEHARCGARPASSDPHGQDRAPRQPPQGQRPLERRDDGDAERDPGGAADAADDDRGDLERRRQQRVAQQGARQAAGQVDPVADVGERLHRARDGEQLQDGRHARPRRAEGDAGRPVRPRRRRSATPATSV